MRKIRYVRAEEAKQLIKEETEKEQEKKI